ncbi:MAG TPA: hypothetical protein VGJ22_14565 [Anaerolineales bacterium]|jgi:hypothetical protein
MNRDSATWISVDGGVVEGHRVASGPSAAYPYGALWKQKPYFKTRGLDLATFYEGTLNISIAPRVFEMAHPEYTFERVEWTDLHPPETFSFSRCEVRFQNTEYEGWVYFPHPETKRAHFQNPSLIEVISVRIPGIGYGDQLQLDLNGREITIRDE